jgi:hypothetical protein
LNSTATGLITREAFTLGVAAATTAVVVDIKTNTARKPKSTRKGTGVNRFRRYTPPSSASTTFNYSGHERIYENLSPRTDAVTLPWPR